MTTHDIAVVVVAFNSEETIDVCLQRLRNAQAVAEIRVVDNHSHDSTMDIVQRHAVEDARVRFIANPDNPGFAEACNQGAAASHAPWLAMVNPDCFVEPHALVALRDASAALDGALVGAQLEDEDGVQDGASRRRDPDFVAMLRQSSARQLAVAEDFMQPLQPVAAVSGALMLLPRTLFERVGGFDQGYRLHAEDLDLCRRVRMAGATVACANALRVVHVRGVSSRPRPVFVEWHKHRGLWRYFCKFDARAHDVATRMAVFGMIWLRFPLAVMKALAAR